MANTKNKPQTKQNRSQTPGVGIGVLIKEVNAKLAEEGIKNRLTNDMLDVIINVIQSNLTNGNNVTIRHFGSFRTVDRKPRVAFNPQDRSRKINIPAKTAVVFRQAKNLKTLMNPQSTKKNSK